MRVSAVTVREFGAITCAANVAPGIDTAVVSKATFDWLLDLQGQWKRERALLRLVNSRTLRIENYVGYLESPSGEGIEILPKTQVTPPDSGALSRSRRLLRDMLAASQDLKPREAMGADLQRRDEPLHEWIVGQYLIELKELVRRGIRFDYVEVEDESAHIRGRLVLEKQLRQPPSKAHIFQVRHEVYTPNRRENRLLKTALDWCLKHTRRPEHWRLANELSHQLADITPYREPLKELPRWQHNKLMRHYATIRSWCRLVLEQLNPDFQYGRYRGIALLFPMEKLFEAYVERALRSGLPGGTRLRAQAMSESLVRHQPQAAAHAQSWFYLKPDFLLEVGSQRTVMDAKWKLLEQGKGTSDDKYGLSQSDFYQLAAYGEKYQAGEGHMALIYPRYAQFSQPLPAFHFSDALTLWVVPFDLEQRALVAGNWCQHLPVLAQAACADDVGTVPASLAGHAA